VCATLGTPSAVTGERGDRDIDEPSLSWTGAMRPHTRSILEQPRIRPGGHDHKCDVFACPLSNNTTYYWKVVAMNNCGNSASGFGVELHNGLRSARALPLHLR